MDFTDDEWEFESFEDGLDGFYDEEYIEDDSEHDDWIWNDFWGEDQ